MRQSYSFGKPSNVRTAEGSRSATKDRYRAAWEALIYDHQTDDTSLKACFKLLSREEVIEAVESWLTREQARLEASIAKFPIEA